jgi:hypothetical protein
MNISGSSFSECHGPAIGYNFSSGTVSKCKLEHVDGAGILISGSSADPVIAD